MICVMIIVRNETKLLMVLEWKHSYSWYWNENTATHGTGMKHSYSWYWNETNCTLVAWGYTQYRYWNDTLTYQNTAWLHSIEGTIILTSSDTTPLKCIAIVTYVHCCSTDRSRESHVVNDLSILDDWQINTCNSCRMDGRIIIVKIWHRLQIKLNS